MPDIHLNIRARPNLPAKIWLAALVATGPALAEEPVQPVWQPAIYCAALDYTRADILQQAEAPIPDMAGDAESAEASGEAYLRISAEALECPSEQQMQAMLTTARIGIDHRLMLAEFYGHGPEVMVLALASESELVCALNFEPALLETARAADTPICGWRN